MNLPRHGCAMMIGLWLATLAVGQGQYSFTDQNTVSSVSGQFVVSSVDSLSPVVRDLNPAANTNVVQLKTALLAMAAERFKIELWRELGLASDASWSGKIYLRLHRARSFDETVTIASSRFLNRWNYEVDLPDMLWRTRFARAMSGVMLLEIANRSTAPNGHAAEVPPWLVDGMAREVVAVAGDEAVVSAPRKKREELAISRLNQSERGFDPLASARQILQAAPALSFDQLSWPTSAQMEGEDGGVYWASAQLFQAELLHLKQGQERMRTMLADLPYCLNWQTAFFRAFNADFKRPIDVEKWWTLRVLNFVRHSPGPRWTTDVSMAQLQELLTVPVDFRRKADALPAHSVITLQSAVKDLDAAQRDQALRAKERDLAFMELRLAPPFGALADEYRLVLADFLGDLRKGPRITATNKHGVPGNGRAGIETTIRRLNELDLRRQEAEAKATAALQASASGKRR